MFSVEEIPVRGGILQYRTEHITGIRCRISPGRLIRGIDKRYPIPGNPEGCSFCPNHLYSDTPVFETGGRISVGESLTFPNKFPFARTHTVTVITAAHTIDRFTKKQMADALRAQAESLLSGAGYSSINCNYLPSAGASMAHPHLQGTVDSKPPPLVERYICGERSYPGKNGLNYWDRWIEHELSSPRFLFGGEISWFAHAVPIGEREVRGFLPVSNIEEFESYTDILADGILQVLDLYRSLGTWAFNFSIFFDKVGSPRGFKPFCSIISRINPNNASLSDTAFMERLHLEPVILTLPEDLGTFYRREMSVGSGQKS